MNKTFLLTAMLAIVPATTFADPGGGTDMSRVNREIEVMTRDGRWDRLVAEGRANKQAFDEFKAREAQGAAVTASRYARQPRR